MLQSLIFPLMILVSISSFGQNIISVKTKGGQKSMTTRVNANSTTTLFTDDGNIPISDIDSLVMFYQPTESFIKNLKVSNIQYQVDVRSKEEIESFTGYKIVRRDDYVLKSKGDTIWGRVGAPNMGTFYNEMSIKIDDSRSVKFHADDNIRFRYNSRFYESHNIGISKPRIVFLELLISGHCSLYKLHYYDVDHMITTNNSFMRPTEAYYLLRPNEEIHEFEFSKIKKGLDNYFEDNSRLMNDIQQGKFKKNDVSEIVKAYNSYKNAANGE